MSPTHIVTRSPGRVVLLLGVIGALCLTAAGLGRTVSPSYPSGVLGLSTKRDSGLPYSPFVRALGTQLLLNGQPWYFTGYDAYQLTGVQNDFSCGGWYTDAQLDEMMRQMHDNSGSTAVRTWFFQSYGGPGNWSQYDRVLNAAAAHDIKIIPTLVNEWGDCEPWPGGVRPYRDVSWYTDGYKQTNDGYPISFRDFAVEMAAHYANNPTIAFWQLVNEAEDKYGLYGGCENTGAGNALRGFADDVGSAMKQVDHNHLINLGTMGGGQCGIQWTEYRDVHAGAMDICEIHDYTPGALPGDQWNGMQVSINFCLGLNKPIFAGEVGIDASVQPDWSTTGVVTAATLAQRAAFFKQKMDAQFGLGTVGFLIWSKSMLSGSQTWDVGPGDPTEAMMRSYQNALNLAHGTILLQGPHATGGEPANGLQETLPSLVRGPAPGGVAGSPPSGVPGAATATQKAVEAVGARLSA